jgi:hypothetical protein
MPGLPFGSIPLKKYRPIDLKKNYSWISETSTPNIRFIGTEDSDSVNTHDLLADFRIVLPYSLRVGIEGGLFGKPVILAASAYYEKMAFAQVANSKEAYFDLIEQNLKNPFKPTFDQLYSAYAEYYIAEHLGLHKTNFHSDAVRLWIMGRSRSCFAMVER